MLWGVKYLHFFNRFKHKASKWNGFCCDYTYSLHNIFLKKFLHKATTHIYNIHTNSMWYGKKCIWNAEFE